jgi:undecaprenyl-diphosphatase
MELHILEIIKAVILGVVEGITEFLPISSTGHLILVNQFVFFDKDFTALFDIVIQLGAILAVLTYFIKKLWPFTKDKIKNKETLNIWCKTIVGVIPAIFFGALFASFIKEKLFNPWVVAISLLVGGVIILFVENKKKTDKIVSIGDLSYKTAFFIGLIQCLSMIPGVSRSASTIMGGMVLGASRVVATEFSFFLAIPTMFAASAYSLLKYKGVLNSNQTLILFVGFIVSFFVDILLLCFFDWLSFYNILIDLACLNNFICATVCHIKNHD